MQVNAVSNYYTNNKYNNTPSFKSLIIDQSALNILKQLSKEDTFELQKIKKRLSKTKFWDMKISSIGNKFEELIKSPPRMLLPMGFIRMTIKVKISNFIRLYTVLKIHHSALLKH